MEKPHEKVVKLTAEILNKSWNPEPGKVTPFSSGSSINDNQISDNHLEHYVQQSPTTPLEGAIANIFNSNFWTNGGEKMTDKTLDVDSSTTTQSQYTNPGTSTTEPDAQSQIAITKMDRPKDSQDEEGKGTYSTTANTTTESPKAGDTTEPTTKAANCPDCNKPMNMCMCDGMSKAAKCPHCGQSMPSDMKKAEDAEDKEEDKVEKAADEKESKEEDAKETPADEKKEEVKKSFSVWQGAFSPDINRGM
jgi:transcription elongation factor Elf1